MSSTDDNIVNKKNIDYNGKSDEGTILIEIQKCCSLLVHLCVDWKSFENQSAILRRQTALYHSK